MTKSDFLEGLKMALNGRVQPSVVTDNMDYYADYINTEIRKGRSEEEVLGLLGDPRMIARTIVDANAQQGSANRGVYADEEQGDAGRGRTGVWKLTRFHGILIGLLVVLVICAVVSLFSAMLPILLPILFVLFMVKVFRDWLN